MNLEHDSDSTWSDHDLAANSAAVALFAKFALDLARSGHQVDRDFFQSVCGGLVRTSARQARAALRDIAQVIDGIDHCSCLRPDGSGVIVASRGQRAARCHAIVMDAQVMDAPDKNLRSWDKNLFGIASAEENFVTPLPRYLPPARLRR
jgi:hypothetical protein